METARKGYSLTVEIMKPVVEVVEEGASKQELGKAIEQAARRAKQGIEQQTDPGVKSGRDEGDVE